MYQYSNTGKQISIQALTKALKRLGDLLQKENKRLELTCCGGIISLMYFHSRAMTQDVNVIELVTFIQRYHIITVHKHTRKTPHETSAKTNG